MLHPVRDITKISHKVVKFINFIGLFSPALKFFFCFSSCSSIIFACFANSFPRSQKMNLTSSIILCCCKGNLSSPA